MRTAGRALLATAAVAVVLGALLGVFALYTRPDFLVTLASQLWACF
jgi:ribose/xylose/arabinose/galactoside ABC-type transport system permease subunit